MSKAAPPSTTCSPTPDTDLHEGQVWVWMPEKRAWSYPNWLGVCSTVTYMKIQKGLSSKTNPNVGEAIPMPSQAHLYNIILVQKAEPLRCLALRTRTAHPVYILTVYRPVSHSALECKGLGKHQVIVVYNKQTIVCWHWASQLTVCLPSTVCHSLVIVWSKAKFNMPSCVMKLMWCTHHFWTMCDTQVESSSHKLQL